MILANSRPEISCYNQKVHFVRVSLSRTLPWWTSTEFDFSLQFFPISISLVSVFSRNHSIFLEVTPIRTRLPLSRCNILIRVCVRQHGFNANLNTHPTFTRQLGNSDSSKKKVITYLARDQQEFNLNLLKKDVNTNSCQKEEEEREKEPTPNWNIFAAKVEYTKEN